MKNILFIITLIGLFYYPISANTIDRIEYHSETNDSLKYTAYYSLSGCHLPLDKLEYVIKNDKVVIALYRTETYPQCDQISDYSDIISISKDDGNLIILEIFDRFPKYPGETEYRDYFKVMSKEFDLSNLSSLNNFSNHSIFINNPIHNKLLISGYDDTKLNIEILNLSGFRLITSIIENGESVDLSNLNSGIYLLVVNKNYCQKFIKY